MVADFSKADLSFAGCGFMCIYHTGVSAALKEYAPHLFSNRIYGASAGAIAAAALICDVCISEATSAILQVICEARAGFLQAFSPTFDLIGLARDGMERMLPENAHIRCSGRLFISLTRYDDCANVVVSQFESKEDLIQAVICSCYIPLFCGFEVPTFHGIRYFDGGFSDNQPKMSSRLTITVSPFSGESDICPMDSDSANLFECVFHNTSFRLTTSNFYRLGACFAPPSQDICSRFCHQGFTDALRFLTKNAITPCVRCLTVQSSLLPIPLYGMEQLRFRRRLDSECGLCLEPLDTSQVCSTELFPEHLQRMLEITKSSDSRLYDYFWSMRAVRFSMNFIQPIVAPINYSLMAFRLAQALLKSDSKSELILGWLQLAIDTVLKEIEDRNLLCTPKFHYRPASGASGKTELVSRTPPIDAPKRDAAAQIYETDDHIMHSSIVDDDDSVSKVIDYAEKHNAILAYHYMDSLNKLRVCEVFDMDRSVPHVKCHFTARLSDFYRSESPIATAKTNSGTLTAPPILHHGTATSARRRTLSTSIPPPLAEERDEEVEREEPSNNNWLDLNSNVDDGPALNGVPPDPVSSHTSSCGESGSSKRDACCSPVRHLKGKPSAAVAGLPAATASPSSSPSFGWRCGSGRRKLSSAANSTAPNGSRATRSPITGKAKSPSLKTIHSSDSDDEVEDDELFVVSNRRSGLPSAGVIADSYDGESDLINHKTTSETEKI